MYLPPISVYRWWARRTEAVNGAIIDAVEKDLGPDLLIADPFAGGGVIPLAAIMRGHRTYAQDLNPWATAGLAAMLGLPPADDLRDAIAVLAQQVAPLVDAAYATELSDGTAGQVSHTFRVATAKCSHCGVRQRLFPHAMVSLLARTERNRPEAYLACPNGHLFLGRRTDRQRCPECRKVTDPASAYTPSRLATCPCGHSERLEVRARSGDWRWEVVLVERARRGHRELALPSAAEVEMAGHPQWEPHQELGDIPVGAETRVLRRHGFRRWEDLYPRRQRALLEQLLEAAGSCSDDGHVVATIRMAIIGSAEMAGHLSRWDRYYLKSYESMAGHRFNFTTLTVEPNVWGNAASGRGTATRRFAQMLKAAEWMERNVAARTTCGPTPAAAARTHQTTDSWVVSGSSERMLLPDASVALTLSDPPYHDDVQYAELSLPLRAWAGLDATTLEGEAVVNGATGQLVGQDDYEHLLVRIFGEVRRVLRPDGHLIFSYANRSLEAWVALLSALDRAGLRAVGYNIVHSENETDGAKRGVRACALDLILDLVPTGHLDVEQYAPAPLADDDESAFLNVVGHHFLGVGRLPDGWAAQLRTDAAGCTFLA